MRRSMGLSAKSLGLGEMGAMRPCFERPRPLSRCPRVCVVCVFGSLSCVCGCAGYLEVEDGDVVSVGLVALDRVGAVLQHRRAVTRHGLASKRTPYTHSQTDEERPQAMSRAK